MVEKVYNMLLKKYGKQNWWPISGRFAPKELEICVGAILKQNTNWKNVEKALDNLIKAKKLSAEDIASTRLSALEKLLRPSGTYRQKARRIKDFANFIANFDGDFYKDVTRDQLLAVKGIGRETADSILLYACNKPYFVVDTYTRRLFSQIGIIKGNEDYDEIRGLIEKNLLRDVHTYREFHALIVENGKKKARAAKVLSA